MRNLLMKAAVAVTVMAAVAAFVAVLYSGLEKQNALLGATEMCAQGETALGPESGIYHGVYYADVVEYYRGRKPKGPISLKELVKFCQQIGFNPGR